MPLHSHGAAWEFNIVWSHLDHWYLHSTPCKLLKGVHHWEKLETFAQKNHPSKLDGNTEMKISIILNIQEHTLTLVTKADLISSLGIIAESGSKILVNFQAGAEIFRIE